MVFPPAENFSFSALVENLRRHSFLLTKSKETLSQTADLLSISLQTLLSSSMMNENSSSKQQNVRASLARVDTELSAPTVRIIWDADAALRGVDPEAECEFISEASLTNTLIVVFRALVDGDPDIVDASRDNDLTDSSASSTSMSSHAPNDNLAAIGRYIAKFLRAIKYVETSG